MKTLYFIFSLFLVFSNLMAQCFVTTTVNNACAGCDGSAVASVIGQGGLTYYWNTTPPQTGPVATNLCPDTFTVIVTDSTGCVAIDTFIVNPVINLTVTTLPPSCSGCTDGSGTATPFGGSPPYSYLWSTGHTTASISNIGDGIYTVCVFDAAACYTCDTAWVSFPSGINLLNTSGLHIYPNPASQFVILESELFPIDGTISVYNLLGEKKLVQKFDSHLLYATDNNKRILDVSTLKPGSYFLQIVNDGKDIIQKLLITKK